MRIELGKLDFELINEALRLLIKGGAEGDLDLRELDRAIVLRNRFHNAFTGWLDMDGEG